MSLKDQAISGIRWAGVSRVFTTLLQFGTVAILARLLDPSDFGLMAMVLVVTGLAQAFADAGISNAIIYRQDATKDQLSSLYWINILAGITIFILVLLARPLIIAYFSEPQLSPYLIGVSIVFVIDSFGQQFLILMQKDLRFRTLSTLEIVSNCFASVLAIIAALLGWGVWSLVLRPVVNSLVRTVMSVAWGRASGNLPGLHFQRSDLKGYTSFGIFQMGERSVNYLSTNVDNLIIGRLLGAEALGFYSLAYQLITFPLSRFNPIITQVAFPTFSKVQDDNETLRRGFLKVVSFVAAIAFPMLAGLFVVAPLFVEEVYGEAWLPAVPAIRILCVVGALKAQGNPIGSLLLSKGRADIGFYWNSIAVILLTAANWIGARWGIEGVAFSSLLTLALIFFPVGFYLRWLVARIQPLPYLASLKIPVLGAGVMMLALLLLSPIWNQFNRNLSLILQIATGALVYLLAMWITNKPFLMEIQSAVLKR